MSPKHPFPAWLALLCSAFALACGDAESRPNILLISVDSLRPDHLGAYGHTRNTSPTIDWLASEGALFEQAVSTTSWTLPSHAALFTGLYDQAHGVMTAADRLGEDHETLAELLRDAGYQTAGFYGAPYLHPSFGMAQGFEVYEGYNRARGSVEADWSGIPDEAFRSDVAAGLLDSGKRITGPAAAAAVAAWIARADARPYFLFLHLWDVHYDYMPPARYVELFDPDYTGSLDASNYFHNQSVAPDMDPRDLQHLLALYDGEIRLTDDTFLDVLDALEAAGRLDETLIVFTADHGEEFFEHGHKGHRKSLYDEALRIPLIVRWPGHVDENTRVVEQVGLIDILPTLLAAAGVAPPANVQGRDLTPLLTGGSLEPAPALIELNTTFVGLRTPERKLLSNGKVDLLFDLASDPAERVGKLGPSTLHTEMQATIARLEQQSRAIREQRGADAQPAKPLDPALRGELRALGYLDE